MHELLENIQLVAEHNNFFDVGFRPSELDDLPELYRQIIDDPAASLHRLHRQSFSYRNHHTPRFVYRYQRVLHSRQTAYLSLHTHNVTLTLTTHTHKCHNAQQTVNSSLLTSETRFLRVYIHVFARLFLLILDLCTIFMVFFLGRLPNFGSRPNNMGDSFPSVRPCPSVRPSVHKKFLRFR